MTGQIETSCLRKHDSSHEPCRACGFVPNWFDVKLGAAGVAKDAPHVLAAFRTFAVVDLVPLLKAFERAGRDVQEALAAAYDLGGGEGVLQYVRALGLPGVAVSQYGWIFWHPLAATDVRHEGAA